MGGSQRVRHDWATSVTYRVPEERDGANPSSFCWMMFCYGTKFPSYSLPQYRFTPMKHPRPSHKLISGGSTIFWLPSPPNLPRFSIFSELGWGNLETFFFFFVNFYCSIVALQSCIGFCCTAKWLSSVYPYIPSFVISFHSGCHRALSRVLCTIQ